MKNPIKLKTLAMLILVAPVTGNAASLITGYATGPGNPLLSLNGGAGSQMFVDSAAPGGNQDPVSGGSAEFNSVLLPGTGLWEIGDTVTITGLAFVLKGNAMGSGNFTFNIREAVGGTGPSGAGGFPPILGSATGSYTDTNSVETMYVNFDAPITFVADANSTTIGINYAFDGGNVATKAGTDLSSNGLQRYNFNNGNIVGGPSNISYQRFSIAGSVAAPIPEPSTALLGTIGALALLRRRR